MFILVSGSTYTQEFVITDQQGNARLSFQNNADIAKAVQENSYYGFGMKKITNNYDTFGFFNSQLSRLVRLP